MKQLTQVKGHYRTVNGKMVWVPPHQAQHEHAAPEAPKAHASVHDEFDDIFKEPAEEKPSVDDEFDSIFAEPEEAKAPKEPMSLDDEFNAVVQAIEAQQVAPVEPTIQAAQQEEGKLYGPPTPAPEELTPTESPSTPPEVDQKLAFIQTMKGASAHYKDKGNKTFHVEVVGDKLHYFGGFNTGILKSIKASFPGHAKWDKDLACWVVPADGAEKLGQILQEFLGPITHFQIPDGSVPPEEPAAPAAAPKLPIGSTDVDFDDVQPGMIFGHNTYGDSTWTILSKDSSSVSYRYNEQGTGKEITTMTGKEGWTKGFKDHLKLNGYVGESVEGPKPPPAFADLKPGMVLMTPKGEGFMVTQAPYGDTVEIKSGTSGKIISLTDEHYESMLKTFGHQLMPMKPEDFKPVADVESSKPVKKRLDKGEKINSIDDVHKGMTLKLSSASSPSLIIEKDASGVLVQEAGGKLNFYNTQGFNNALESFKQAGKYHMAVSSTDGSDYQLVQYDDTPKVGETKVINGVTYVFNENHRWEKASESTTKPAEAVKGEMLSTLENLPKGVWQVHNGFRIVKTTGMSGNILVRKNDIDGKPLPAKVKAALKELEAAGYMKKKYAFVIDGTKLSELADIIEGKNIKPVKKKSKSVVAPASTSLPVYKKIPGGFPFEQIGPQKGSNPGGLYKDQFGKQWYIKFPETEDHAKNELLASQLYKMAGIAVPNLKLVSKDGKVGIASEFVADLHQGDSAQLSKAPGAKEGFVADAWLSNWDSVGLANDNLLLDKDGNAVRIDVGGSLLYRAQGAPKGLAFGNDVTELSTLLDASKNPKTAAVFQGMTKDQQNKAAIAVLSIPDGVIEKAVEMWGPGDEAAKKELAGKLIARKKAIAKAFPEANLIANPPAPDPHKLPVDASKLPGKVDFANYNGPGKGLSSSAYYNKANQATFDALYDAAMKGDLIAFKDFQYEAVDKETGASLGNQPIGTHKNKDIKAFYQSAIEHMENIAYPGTKIDYSHWFAKSVTSGDPQALSSALPSHPFGTTVDAVHKENRLGFWIKLGHIQSPEEFMPAKSKNVGPEEKKLVFDAYQKMPQTVKTWLGNVQSSGHYNIGDKAEHATDYNKKMVKQAYDHAVEFPEGTIIRRWLSLPGDMIPQLNASEPGLVFQNPRSQCCSMQPNWGNDTHFDGSSKNGALLEIHYAKGAKGLPTAGSGSYASEGEITSLPGQRYMLINKETHLGRPKYTLLALPPDPGYIANPEEALHATA